MKLRQRSPLDEVVLRHSDAEQVDGEEAAPPEQAPVARRPELDPARSAIGDLDPEIFAEGVHHRRHADAAANAAVPDSVRRRGANPLSVQGPRSPALAPTTAAAPLLAGARLRPGHGPDTPQVTAPLLAGAGVMSPLVRAVADESRDGTPQGLTLNATVDSTPKATPRPDPLYGRQYH